MDHRIALINTLCVAVCLVGCNPDDPTKLLDTPGSGASSSSSGTGGSGAGGSSSSTGGSGGAGGSSTSTGGSGGAGGGEVPVIMEEFVPGDVIVKFSPPKSFADLQVDGLDVAGWHLAADKDLPVGAVLLKIQFTPNETVAKQMAYTLDVVNGLTSRPDVEYAHVNSIFHLTATPSDPLYSLYQWNFGMINMEKAWNFTQGSSNVVIAILDSGKLAHPEIPDARWPIAIDCTTTTGGMFPTCNGPNPMDDTATSSYGHGLHVAGILGATTSFVANDPNAVGVAGICPNCKLLPIKMVAGVKVEATLDQTVTAIDYASDPAGGNAKVINISYGNKSISLCQGKDALQDAIDRATSRNVVVVAASGNEAENADADIYVPARCTNVIAVGATDVSGLEAASSNKGPRIDVLAPGGSNVSAGTTVNCTPMTGMGSTGVLSTWLASGGPCYRYWSGTSIAVPHVAGVAALMYTIYPGIKPARVRECLIASAKVPNPDGSCAIGNIDAEKALICADTIFGDGFETGCTTP